MTATKTVTDQERVELQLACVREHIALENAETKNIDEILSKTFATENVFYDVVPGNAGRLEGLDGIVGFYEMLLGTLPDMRLKITHEYGVPGCVVLEGIVMGTHSAEFAGVPASGRYISFPFAAMYIFAEDPTKLVAERAYWDNAMVIAQMQGEAEPVNDYVWDGANPYQPA